MAYLHRFVFGSLILGFVVGGVYVGYSAWYSYDWYARSSTGAVCIEGIPIASAARLSEEVRQFRWRWVPLNLPRLIDIPAADVVKVRLPKRPSNDRVVIQFTPESSLASRRAYVRWLGGELERSLSRLDTYVVSFENGVPRTFPPARIIVNIERDDFAVVSATNDEHYVNQWALPYLEVERLWLDLPEDAEPITIAVIDSGICKNHPDLAGRIAFGWDFVEEDNNPQDEMGHGCGVAGVIAAVANNEIGIAGIAPMVKIMPLRVLDQYGVGSQSSIAAAIMFAADRRVDIINLSLASPRPSDAVESAVNYALEKGVTVIAAAGNNGTEGAWYPAGYPNVLSVGSIDQTEERSRFSNYGTNVDIYAPGRDIYTTAGEDGYITMTGTSFAAPIVSGLTALDMAINGVGNGDGQPALDLCQ